MIVNCILVDDEPASREVLEKYISNCSSLKLVASCKNAFEANEVILSSEIQLIFLDINMPKLSGIKFYKSLTNPPFVVFTTAYPEHAVEGFELDAVDYLLKPFSFERFLKAVNKATKALNPDNNTNQSPAIILKSDKKLYRVRIDELYYLEAVGDYVKVSYANQSIIVHETLQNLFNQLCDSDLIRVHRSFAISLSRFDHIEGNSIIINNISVPIGQTYRKEFFERINSGN